MANLSEDQLTLLYHEHDVDAALRDHTKTRTDNVQCPKCMHTFAVLTDVLDEHRLRMRLLALLRGDRGPLPPRG